MFDLKFIRDNPDAFDAAMKRRGVDPVAADIIALDEDRRATQTELQDLQRKRNDSSKEIGKAKASGDNARAEEMIKQVADLKDEIQKLEDKDRELGERITDVLSTLPNIVEGDVPDGNDEASNVEVRRVGEPDRWNNAPDHVDIGEKLGMMDFSTAAKMSGARFVLLRNGIARLERALAQFMLDTHTAEFGYMEMSPPLLVRDNAVYGTGQLPKFHEDLFHTNSGHWLIPTAEVSLTNTVADSILAEEELPLRLTAYTPCFRSEAGAAGKDTRGMIRQHQFYKVELVSITTPDQSEDELERMTGCAEDILKRLELPFRTIVKCIGDTGFSARKSYDLEVWLPGQNAYREISSCSNCGDFQARRMKARYRPAGQKGTQHVHTLNGSGVAVGRALVAVLENYHQADGSVIIPDVLKPYMGGLEKIEPRSEDSSDAGLAANA